MSPTLDEYTAAGYVTDEWERWQQGSCLEYALALISIRPHLRFGSCGAHDSPATHFYAHDDRHAYDSAGRHVLPYHGIDGSLTCTTLDDDPRDYDVPDVAQIPAAIEHAERNGILDLDTYRQHSIPFLQNRAGPAGPLAQEV